MEIIKEWIQANNLNVNWLNERVFEIADKKYLCLVHVDGKIFSEDFQFLISEDVVDFIQGIECNFYCFHFGGKVYYSSVDSDKPQLNLLKYIGKAKDASGYPHLAIHGGYEICSGSRSYADWCKKANFLSIQALGLNEFHTLAGALKFQEACLKAKIKPIIGETVTIKGDSDYKVILYVANYNGWRNLLRIHKRLNVDNESRYIEQDFLLKHGEGLYCVIRHDTQLDDQTVKAYRNHKFAGLYFQFNPIQYKSQQRDMHCLECLKTYLRRFQDQFPLALICDSYYLDKEDGRVKKILSFIDGGKFDYQSDGYYFKSLEDVVSETIEMFTTAGEDFALNILNEALSGSEQIEKGCDFKIKTGEIHLPKYELSEEEKKSFNNSQELFWHLIEKGIEEKVIAKGLDPVLYMDRVATEMEVISLGKFEDYFLILRDIINWCESNETMVGTGRGSVAGSIVALLLGITKVDALEYDLIFERFLNKSRIGKGLPDIDTDFISRKRDDVKKYIEQRFGITNVCSIGTYNALKLKAAFRDVLRFAGEPPQTVNYFSAIISESNDKFETLFYEASQSQKLKEFVNDHLESINDLDLILGQPRSASIHAAGIIITPTDNNGESMQIYDWFPCKMMDGVLISEWEGPQLDDCGFLKADILGLSQLDKLTDILDLIKERTGELLNLNEINKNDRAVFDLFKKGWNQDVFQFGTDGLSSYCREVKPESVEELAAINALYRPGPMDSGAHIDYVRVKFGKKQPEYDWGCENLLKSTYGLMVYQEQAIRIVQKVGGFSLTDGDGVRKATGKKDLQKMKSYRDQFVAGAVANGCPEFEAVKIWDKIEVFAHYSFNYSHAVAYSLIGYQSQWLKCHYPLEFWSVSLQYASDDDVHKRVHEIRKFENIKLSPPDINKSRSTFYTDFDSSTIYWSLSRIKQMGEATLKGLEEERNVGGSFFSLEEFVKRIKGKKVNKTAIVNLILSGCFDSIYNIENSIERLALIEEYYSMLKEDLPEEFKSENAYKEFFWYKNQRNLSSFGFFDYESHIVDMGYSGYEFANADQISLTENDSLDVFTAGILQDVVKRKTKKGEMGKLTIDQNSNLIDVVVWNDSWEVLKNKIEPAIGNGIVINGKILYDGYNKKNCLYSIDKTDVEIF